MIIKFQLCFNNADDLEKCHFDIRSDSLFLSGSSRFLGEWDLHNAVEMKMVSHKSPMQDSGEHGSSGSGSISSASSSSMSTSSSQLDMSSSSSSASSSSSSATATPFYQHDNNTQPQIINFEANVFVEDGDDSPGEKQLQEELTKLRYKYYVAQKTVDLTRGEKFFLKQVEYNWRKLAGTAGIVDLNDLRIVQTNDQWPLYDDEDKKKRVDHGWLLNDENEFQFNFYDNPCQLWLTAGRPVHIEIIPWTTNSGLTQLEDFSISQVDYDEHKMFENKKSQFNAFNNPEAYSTFRVRTFEDPANLLFQFNIRELGDNSSSFSSSGTTNSNSITTGYFKVSRNLLNNSTADVDIALLNNNQIVGSLKAEILLITGLADESQQTQSIVSNYNYHMSKSSCVHIGHRGMGKTFGEYTLPVTDYVENTIDSFREAYKRGAQMVEFDIVLTKDNVPVVYHDFAFCIDQVKLQKNKNKKTVQQTVPPLIDDEEEELEDHRAKYLSVGVNQMTYTEIKQNKIYSQEIIDVQLAGHEVSPNPDKFTSAQMFPTLKEMCTELDENLGFNVEIKYPIFYEDGTHEIDTHLKWMNRNTYVDIVLKELLACTKDNDKRCIIISTFDPNLCSMIRMKQNKFPVMFITQGINKKWKVYRDTRTKNTKISLNFAKAQSLHGLVAHAEELKNNLHLTNILSNQTSKSANFYAYSWGDDVNDVASRQLMTKLGINGIIYDRMTDERPPLH